MEDPKEHGIRRKIFARAFSKTEIRARWEPMVKQTIERALENVKFELASGQVDILQWWLSMATDVSATLMFGNSFGTLESKEFDNYFRTLQLAGKGGAIADEIPFLGFIGRRLPHKAFREMFKSNDYLSEFGRQAITNGMSNNKDNLSIFTRLEGADEEPNTKGSPVLTTNDLSAEAGNFILAGTDTGAFTLTCLVWAVLRQPPLQAALEKEVASPGDDLSDAQLEALPLLGAVLNEALRLYGPAASSLPRMVPKGGTVLGQYFIPEETTVSTQAWTLHRDDRFWPEPQRFNPSRWLDDSSKEATRNAFMPFGAGPRGCIGIHLAMMEMRFAVALFFRNFPGVKLSSDTSPVLEFENYFLMKPKGKFNIVLDEVFGR